MSVEGVGDEVLILGTVLAIGGSLLYLIGRNQRTTTRLQPVPPAREASTVGNVGSESTRTPSTGSIVVDCRVLDADSRTLTVQTPCSFGNIKQMVRSC